MKSINPYLTKYASGQIKTGNRIVKPDIFKPIVGRQVITPIQSRDFINLLNDYRLKLDVYGDWYFDQDYQNNISIVSDNINTNNNGIVEVLDDQQMGNKYGIVFYSTYVDDQIIYNCSGIRIKCMNSLKEVQEYQNVYIAQDKKMDIECYVYKDTLYDTFEECLSVFKNLLCQNNYIRRDEYNYYYSDDVEHPYDTSLKDIYCELYTNITFIPNDNYYWNKHDSYYELIFDTMSSDVVNDVEIRVNGNITKNQFVINGPILNIIFPLNTIKATDEISLLVKSHNTTFKKRV